MESGFEPDSSMTLDEFRAALASPHPPPALSAALVALWHDARGHWDQAHTLVSEHDPSAPEVTGLAADCAWVHAYLHRKEGDISNAGYWYARAKKPPASGPLEDEWSAIVSDLLS